MAPRTPRRTTLVALAVLALACTGASAVGNASLPAITDPTALLKYADDFGFYVHEFPLVAFCPSTSAELISVVRWAYANRIATSTRGQGHSSSGQTQSKVAVIDTACMNKILNVDVKNGFVEVQAGATWNDVFNAVSAVGHRVLIDTDAKILSVGGTLSIGGASVLTSTNGFAGHHVLSLKIVTGRGSLIECSPTLRSSIFNHVLGGQGQLGIISSVKIRIAPVNVQAFSYNIAVYNDFRACWSDLYSFIIPGETRTALGLDGAYATIYPNNADTLARFSSVFDGVRQAAGSDFLNNFLSKASVLCIMDVVDLDGSSAGKLPWTEARIVVPVGPGPVWNAFNLRYNQGLAAAEQSPFFASPRFSFLSFSPTAQDDIAARTYVENAFIPLLQNPTATLGISVYDRAGIRAGPIIGVPRDSHVLMITASITTISIPGSRMSADVTHVLTRNIFTNLYNGLRALKPGTKLYPFTLVDGYDWKEHYGANYDTLRALKKAHDPRNIMGRGAAIFSDRPTKRSSPLPPL